MLLVGIGGNVVAAETEAGSSPAAEQGQEVEVVLLNEVRRVDGALEMGPLLSDASGEIFGIGVLSSKAAVDALWHQIRSLPITDQARLQYNHYAATPLHFDVDGDGETEDVFVTIVFPQGREVERPYTNPTTGQAERRIYRDGRLLKVVAADRIVQIDYDKAHRESASRTYANRGDLDTPESGALLDETQTIETWPRNGDPHDWDPYAPVITKLRFDHVTGAVRKETYGLFPDPVEVCENGWITRNRFHSHGLLDEAWIYDNGITSEDFERPTLTQLRQPILGQKHFHLKSQINTFEELQNANYITPLRRENLITGYAKTTYIDQTRRGRKTAETQTDTLGDGQSFSSRTEYSYAEEFYYGRIPLRSVQRAEPSERVLRETESLDYNPATLRLIGRTRDYTGRIATNTWDARWEDPIVSQSAGRHTVVEFNRSGTSYTGRTQSAATGEILATFGGQWDASRGVWIEERQVWYKKGIPARVETNHYSLGGRLVVNISNTGLATYPEYDADGFEIRRKTYAASAPGQTPEILQRMEEDYAWEAGGRRARVQLYLEGEPYDRFAVARDPAGRLVRDRVRNLPELHMETRIEWDGETERQTGSEVWQNDVLRVKRRVLPELEIEPGRWVVPVVHTPVWGLAFTNRTEIGTFLGRAGTWHFENGYRREVTEWFSGSSIPARTELLDASGRVVERYVLQPGAGRDRGMPYDLLTRLQVDEWNQEAVAEQRAVIQGTDVLWFQDGLGLRTYFDLSRPHAVPDVDLSLESGADNDEGSAESPGTSEQAAYYTVELPATPPDLPDLESIREPLLKIVRVDLRGLFSLPYSVQYWDRSGALRLELSGKLARRAGRIIARESLMQRVARDLGNPNAEHQWSYYSYEPGYLVEQTDNSSLIPSLDFQAESPRGSREAIPVNQDGRREWQTRVEVFRNLAATPGSPAAESKGPNSPVLAETPDHVVQEMETAPVRQLYHPRRLKRNVYLPEVRDVWMAWTGTDFAPKGSPRFSSEFIYNARGHVSTRVDFKHTRTGAPARKTIYQISALPPDQWSTHRLERGINAIPISLPAEGDLSGANFIYLHTRDLKALRPQLHLVDAEGNQAVVTDRLAGSADIAVGFWPIRAGEIKWLPDLTTPRHGTTIEAVNLSDPRESVLAVSVPELQKTGLELAAIRELNLIVECPEANRVLLLSPARRLMRNDQSYPDTSRYVLSTRYLSHSSGLETITRTRHQADSGEDIGEEESYSMVIYHGFPVASIMLRHDPPRYRTINLMDYTSPQTPEPLYSLSLDGKFLEYFRTRREKSIKVYRIAHGFEVPKVEYFRPGVLEDEISRGVLAYGYHPQIEIPLSKGEGPWTERLAILKNRISASIFKFLGDQALGGLAVAAGRVEPAAKETNWSVPPADRQREHIDQLPLIAEMLLSEREPPWWGSTAGERMPSFQFPRLLEILKDRREGFTDTTVLIPTAWQTQAQPFVNTIAEADLVRLAVRFRLFNEASELLGWYWATSRGGTEPIHNSYDLRTGSPLDDPWVQQRAFEAGHNAMSQIAVAEAALELGMVNHDATAIEFARRLVNLLLADYRAPNRSADPRGLTENPFIPSLRHFGVRMWPSAGEYSLHTNARFFLLLRRMTEATEVFDPNDADVEQWWKARREQEDWLRRNILAKMDDSGVPPRGLFEIQDIHHQKEAVAPERWTSPAAWLAWLEAAHYMGISDSTLQRWLDNLARVHGVEINGHWGLDWSLALTRPDAISTELTAELVRVAGLIGHAEAENFALNELSHLLATDPLMKIYTSQAPRTPIRSGQGFPIYPQLNLTNWQDTLTHYVALGDALGRWQDLNTGRAGESAPAGGASIQAESIRAERDLTALIWAIVAFYLSILMVAIFWWLLRYFRLRKRHGGGARGLVGSQLSPEAMHIAEARWARRVAGATTPDTTRHTRYSNAPVEQNFLIQLRTIYKLVFEWRRRENHWETTLPDHDLAEEGGDAWLNGMDEFAVIVGIYMRFVVKAGRKDGASREDVLEENEDSNHIWSRLVMYFSEYFSGLATLLKLYDHATSERTRQEINQQIMLLLNAMGVRQRREAFDARHLFDYPRNPDAFDQLIVQEPGTTLRQVLVAMEARLGTPASHVRGFIQAYKGFKAREKVYPIHPYWLEAAKILPHFIWMGLLGVVLYNNEIAGMPVLPYLRSLAFDMVAWSSLIWALPMFCGYVLNGIANFVDVYRYEASMRPPDESEFFLFSSLTGLFNKSYYIIPLIRPGWHWNPHLYDGAGHLLRTAGLLILGVQLMSLETPSFATFLILKGLLALLMFLEAAAVILPVSITWISKRLQDYVADHPHAGPSVRFLNRLNLTATLPISFLWHSFKYHYRLSVPTGGLWANLRAIAFYFSYTALFIACGSYVFMEVLGIWFEKAYQGGLNVHLLVGGFVFFNTMYLLRFGLFVFLAAVASAWISFPVKTVAGLVASAIFVATAVSPTFLAWLELEPTLGYAVAGGLLAIAVIRDGGVKRVAASLSRRIGKKRDPADPPVIPKDRTLGVVYMSGDDLSHRKLTPEVLLSRWQLLDERMASEGRELLAHLHAKPTEPQLKEWFQELDTAEKSAGITLWHPRQLVLADAPPAFASELGLNIPIQDAAARERILSAWHVRRWLVSMLSPAGHSQDTGVNLVEMAVKIASRGWSANTAFYLIQNKYDSRGDNRPSQLPYDEGELGHRDKLASLLMAMAPGSRAYNLNDWTPFGFKAGGLVAMDLVPEESLDLTNILLMDRNATAGDLDALMEDLEGALTDPGVVNVVPGRSTTNTRTPIGQGSQMLEEGHRALIKGVMAVGGNAGESVGTGWGNIQAVYYGRVQEAITDPTTSLLPMTARMKRGSSLGDRVEGMIGFGPHAIGISEDIWAVTQATHNAIALGLSVKYRQSRAFWHKIRETWSHADWFSAFPRWAGGYLQMMQDPIMQRINDDGPLSVFAKEIRASNGRFFLSAPFALLNILLMPLAILWDASPFVQILVILWNFGLIMNQVLTLLGLVGALEASGFCLLTAAAGAAVSGGATLTATHSHALSSLILVFGFLAGGFLPGLGRWLYDRGRDILLFGPQLVIHVMGQMVRQSLEFVLSGASANDAYGVNVPFRSWAGPREDRPWSGYANMVNLKVLVWGIGLGSLLLNLIALSNLDFLNVLLLLPSLLFSVSALVGPFLMCPKPGRRLGWIAAIPKLAGWITASLFYIVVARLIAAGPTPAWLAYAMLAGLLAVLLRRALKYAFFRTRLEHGTARLRELLSQAGLASDQIDAEVPSLSQNPKLSPDEIHSRLSPHAPDKSGRQAVVDFLQNRMYPLMREPLESVRQNAEHPRWKSEWQRSFLLGIFTLLWFFIVPIPGLLVFTAFDYRFSLDLYLVCQIVAATIGLAIFGLVASQTLGYIARSGLRGRSGLRHRLTTAYNSFRRRYDQIDPSRAASIYALLTDAQTYVDQHSQAYAAKTASQIEHYLHTQPPSSKPAWPRQDNAQSNNDF